MIPKSLHTVTVLVTMARYMKAFTPGGSDSYYVHLAVSTLGYVDESDTYSLIHQAIKKMGKV